MIKVKSISLMQSIRSPTGGHALDSLSFDSSIYELWDCGERIYIARGDNVIGIPITAVKRIEYFKLEDTPLGSKPLEVEVEAPVSLDVPVKRGPGRPPTKHLNG